MIFKMKHLITTLFLLFFASTIVNGQNVMYLDEYTICSCELDSIIDMVLIDAEKEDLICVSVKKVGINNFKIFISAFSSYNLHYNKNIIGYALKDNKTILFCSNAKDMISKKSDSHKLIVRCIPPPNENSPLTVLGTDGLKEWFFRIDKGEIILLRKILKW